MASENKKRKTDKKLHWGRGGAFLKMKGTKMKGVCFFNASDRRANNKEINEI